MMRLPRNNQQKTTGATYFRAAHIEVKATSNWLTADGETDAEDGWAEMRQLIEAAINRIFAGKYKFPATPQITWDGWDGEPERED